MVSRTALVFVIILSILGGTVSCMFRGPSDVRREIADATGARYEREFGLTLGRISMSIARWGMRVAEKHSEEEIPVSLKGVRKVQIGVYQVKRGSWNEDHERFDPSSLGEWVPIVKVQEDGEDVHVLFRMQEGRTRAMLVLVSDSDELVIVRIKGKLDGILRDTMRYALQEAEREELYEPALAQLEEREDSLPLPAGRGARQTGSVRFKRLTTWHR